MSSFELPVSKIRVELSYFDICVQRGLLFAESYFRSGRKVNGSWIYSVQNCLEEFIAEFLNVIVDRKRQPEQVCKVVS
jgi:hypothetical protein